LELIPYYQAILDIQDNHIIGHEVTIKASEVGRMLPANRIIKRAAKCGTIPELDTHVFELAFAAHPVSECLFLNVHPRTLDAKRLSFPERCPLTSVVLEITEGSRIALEADELVAYLKPFRDRGMRIAIDDYGTGWSNLQRVVKLAPEFIKLDPSLVQDIGGSLPTQRLVNGMIAFCRQNHIDLIAEGIETKIQASTIQALGVQYAQGYYYHRPAPQLHYLALDVKVGESYEKTPATKK